MNAHTIDVMISGVLGMALGVTGMMLWWWGWWNDRPVSKGGALSITGDDLRRMLGCPAPEIENRKGAKEQRVKDSPERISGNEVYRLFGVGGYRPTARASVPGMPLPMPPLPRPTVTIRQMHNVVAAYKRRLAQVRIELAKAQGKIELLEQDRLRDNTERLRADHEGK